MSMKTVDIHTLLNESYLQLLKNLSPSHKLDLIAKLTQSVKDDIQEKNNSFERSFGAWQSEESADEIVESIRNSRKFDRKTEEL